jgi:chain length determinant protein tyrosine kinase EpsG
MKTQFEEFEFESMSAKAPPVLAPLHPHVPLRVVPARAHGLRAKLVIVFRPASAEAEAVRSLRTQVQLRWFQKGPRLLAVTAPHARHGSTLLTANLAIAFAQAGQRTLLLDANLRRPRQRLLFGLQPALGLVDLLQGRGALKSAPTPIESLPNLWILGADEAPANPQGLLTHPSFMHLTESLQALYDVVLIDTPPVLEHADAQIVAALARGCLVVMRRAKTRVVELERMRDVLQTDGTTVVGATLYG